MSIRKVIAIFLFVVSAALLMAQATDLFISEYVEGTSNNKAIEIFNGTGAAVDLSQYSLKKQTNGAGAFGNEVTLTGTLANNDVYVIVLSSTTGTTLQNEPYVDLATTSYCLSFNGNDAIALYKAGVQLDVVGNVDDPANWGQDMTLVRNPEVSMPTVNFSMSEWTQYPVGDYTHLGSHVFTGGTTDPLIHVSSPNGGESWLQDSQHTITWAHANFTGNVKIELMNGATPTTLVESIEDTGSWVWNISTTVLTGSNYKIKVSAISGTPSDMSDATFTIAPAAVVTDCPTIAALRQGTADATSLYRFTGVAYVSYLRTTRNQKYIEDATGGVLIDDPNGVIASEYGIGDGITGIKGTLTLYHQMIEFVPVQDPGQAVSQGHVFTPATVSLAELAANYANYEAKLIRLKNVSFAADTTGGIFVNSRSYDISDNSGSGIYRTNFSEANYIGTSIPDAPMNFWVLPIRYDANIQVVARSLTDFGVATNDPVVAPQVGLIGNYPNPFQGTTDIRINTKASDPVTVEVFNAKGQKIRTLAHDLRASGETNLTWNGADNNGNKVPSGIYFYKMKSGSYSSTKKMILIK